MPGAPYFLGCRRPLTLMVRGARSSLRRFLSEASRIREEIIKMKIGAVTLGAPVALGIVTGAWAQSSGAGGTGRGAGRWKHDGRFNRRARYSAYAECKSIDSQHGFRNLRRHRSHRELGSVQENGTH
jgi:hypothetical protein